MVYDRCAQFAADIISHNRSGLIDRRKRPFLLYRFIFLRRWIKIQRRRNKSINDMALYEGKAGNVSNAVLEDADF